MQVLKRSFYARQTDKVAQELLGKILVRELPEGRLSGRIVETEAYFGPGDPASHASSGRTPRNEVMFGPPGRAYIYFTYGMHYLFNVVTEEEGVPGAVLIRALEPLEGLAVMQTRRGTNKLKDLTSGPAKLTQAMGIDLAFNCWDVTRRSKLYLMDMGGSSFKVVKTSRIGVPLDPCDNFRYYIEDNPFVSRK
jgi:DNA-3-methyladenine glycosylase